MMVFDTCCLILHTFYVFGPLPAFFNMDHYKQSMFTVCGWQWLRLFLTRRTIYFARYSPLNQLWFRYVVLYEKSGGDMLIWWSDSLETMMFVCLKISAKIKYFRNFSLARRNRFFKPIHDFFGHFYRRRYYYIQYWKNCADSNLLEFSLFVLRFGERDIRE